MLMDVYGYVCVTAEHWQDWMGILENVAARDSNSLENSSSSDLEFNFCHF